MTFLTNADPRNLSSQDLRIKVKERVIPGIITLVILSIFLFQCYRYWPLTIDDAYISARYAWNASQGRGLVFNPGERVMGYTNLLLVLIETLAYSIGGDGIIWAKLAGLGAGIVVLFLTIEVTRLVSCGAPNAGLLAAGLLTVYPYLALNSVIGLETSLFTALITGSIVLFIKNWLDHRWSMLRQLGLALLLFLAAVTRPEGIGLAAILWFLQVAVAAKDLSFIRDGNRTDLQRSWKQGMWFPVFILLLIPVIAMLTIYYGSPVPNTFWAKTAAGFSLYKYRLGSSYLGHLITETGGALLVTPMILLPLIHKGKAKSVQVILCIGLFYGIYITYTGGDWMMGYRYIVPVLPCFFALAAAGYAQIWQRLESDLTHLSLTYRKLFVAILALLIMSPSFPVNQSYQPAAQALSTGYTQAHGAIADWLRDTTPSNSSIALMDIGLIGFVSDRYIIDITGLVNREIAALMHKENGLHSSSLPTAQMVAEHVLSKRPDYILIALGSGPGAKPIFTWSHDEAIYNSPAFTRNYRFLFTMKYHDYYYLSLYQKMD